MDYQDLGIPVLGLLEQILEYLTDILKGSILLGNIRSTSIKIFSLMLFSDIKPEVFSSARWYFATVHSLTLGAYISIRVLLENSVGVGEL